MMNSKHPSTDFLPIESDQGFLWCASSPLLMNHQKIYGPIKGVDIRRKPPLYKEFTVSKYVTKVYSQLMINLGLRISSYKASNFCRAKK